MLELGSGAGFFQKYLPTAVTSEIFFCPGLDLVCDATELPFATDSLKALVMTDVLHHVPDPRRFFAEAGRCVRPGGAIIMVEPWVSAWSRIVYDKLHHEPFRPEAEDWAFPSTGPLSGANGALPWLLFYRDRAQFEREFPEWEIVEIRPFMPLRYLLSGGISMCSLMPGFSFGFWKRLESLFAPLLQHVAMFALVCLRRRPDTPTKADLYLAARKSGFPLSAITFFLHRTGMITATFLGPLSKGGACPGRS